MAAPDSADVRNSTYVRTMLENNAVQLKARIRELTDEVEHLRGMRTRITTETQDYVNYATAELKTKDDTIAQLRSRLHDVEFGRDTDLRKLQQTMQEALDTAISNQRAMEAELRDKLRTTEMKLERSQQFLERRDEMETRIEELQTTLEAERAATKKALQDLERKYLLEKSALVKEHQSQFQELRRQARAEAQSALHADTKRVLYENKQMGDELKLQSEETKVLAKERLATAEQARVLAREVEIYADKEKEWARQGSRKTQENKALRAHIVELEAHLSAEKGERERLRMELTRKFEEDTAGMRLELEGVKSLLSMKTKEVTTLKRLSSIILQQRTELEQFFLDALTEVKLEIARKRKAAKAISAYTQKSPFERIAGSAGVRGVVRGGASLVMQVPPKSSPAGMLTARSLPPASPLRTAGADVLHSPGGVSAPDDVLRHLINEGADMSVTQAELRRVALSDLSPEDRERVLRILFARINNFKAPHSARRERPDSYDDEEEIPTEFTDHPDESTTVGAPFGLSADIPRHLTEVEYKRNETGSHVSPTPSQRYAPRLVTAESPMRHQPERDPLMRQALVDTTPIEALPDTLMLADHLAKKIADRNALVSKLG